MSGSGPHGEPAGETSPAPSGRGPGTDMARWGRRAATIYLVVAGLALVAMLVETVLGHPGVGTMFAAILAAPWSMLAAGFLPPLPRDWPMAAGLAIRMAPLALFMLLNAAIVAGIAARSERDLRGAASRALLVALLLALPLLSGCNFGSRQVVLLARPITEGVYTNAAGVRTILYQFDLSTSPTWARHRGKLVDVTEVTFVGLFTNPLQGPAPGPLLSVTISMDALVPGPLPPQALWWLVWGPLPIEYPETRRVGWEEGTRLFGSNASLLRSEVMGDGRFALAISSEFSDPAQGGVDVTDFHLGAVLQVR